VELTGLTQWRLVHSKWYHCYQGYQVSIVDRSADTR